MRPCLIRMSYISHLRALLRLLWGCVWRLGWVVILALISLLALVFASVVVVPLSPRLSLPWCSPLLSVSRFLLSSSLSVSLLPSWFFFFSVCFSPSWILFSHFDVLLPSFLPSSFPNRAETNIKIFAFGNGTDTPGMNQKLLPWLNARNGSRFGVISESSLPSWIFESPSRLLHPDVSFFSLCFFNSLSAFYYTSIKSKLTHWTVLDFYDAVPGLMEAVIGLWQTEGAKNIHTNVLGREGCGCGMLPASGPSGSLFCLTWTRSRTDSIG